MMAVFPLILAGLLLAWSLLPYMRLSVPGGGFFLLIYKSFAASFSLLIGALGLIGLVLGAVGHLTAVAAAYALVVIMAGITAIRVMRTPEVLTAAFGSAWPAGESLLRRRHSLRRSVGIRIGAVPAPRWQPDIPFCTPPGSSRPLLCDIWQPPAHVAPSGLAFIYFHGSGWTIFDKDYRTRTLFSRLASQGHVVMDVAYRLFPETDIAGMVGDVRRSVSWMKTHAADYGVRPDRIVLGGGSAGAHIAMLAAYTEGMPDLTPADLRSVDTSVRAVVSWYGPVDLAACYRHYEVARLAEKMPSQPDWNGPVPPAVRRLMGKDAERLRFQHAAASGRLDWIVGATPEEDPERYAFLSPTTHVHAGCPPTLLMQGRDDMIVPIGATTQMYERLRQVGVPTALLVLPVTDHAFDLFALSWSPAARKALWHTERFLAIMAE